MDTESAEMTELAAIARLAVWAELTVLVVFE